jgi:hypothetical protein
MRVSRTVLGGALGETPEVYSLHGQSCTWGSWSACATASRRSSIGSGPISLFEVPFASSPAWKHGNLVKGASIPRRRMSSAVY